MRKHALVASLFAAVVAPSLAPSLASADLSDEVKPPDKKAPRSSWSAAQQFTADTFDLGYSNLSGLLLYADELGDKLSESGRAKLISGCFDRFEKDAGTKALIAWAVCGTDVKAFDMKKFAKELADAKASQETITTSVEWFGELLAKAKAIGAAIEAEAKSDPGIQLTLKLVDNAKADWASYIGKGKAEFDRYVVLKDAVRTEKTNNPAFAGCYEAIKPAWDKHVNTAVKKIPWDVGGDPMIQYMRYLGATPEGFILATSFAACAWSTHESGESPYAAAAGSDFGGDFRAGYRTIALGKLLDPSYQPKFADRSLRLEMHEWKLGVTAKPVEARMAMMTPQDGIIAAFKPNGELTKITFKSDKVEKCLEWAETNRISSITGAGNINYDKKCLRRGFVKNQTTPVDVPTKYLVGAKPGDAITVIRDFPLVAWKGKKITMLLGVAIK